MPPEKRCPSLFKSLVIGALMAMTTVSIAFAQNSPESVPFTEVNSGEVVKQSEEQSVEEIKKAEEVSFAQKEEPPKTNSKKNEMAVGLGYGVLHIPIDADLETNGSPVNLFFDFDCIFIDGVKWRVGYNTTKSKMEFDAFNKTWEQEFDANTLYLAYRGVNKLTENIRLIALIGLDYVNAELKTSPGSSSTKGTGFGGRIGIGTFYYIGGIGLGVQYELNTASVAFEDATIDMGGNQLQAIASLNF